MQHIKSIKGLIKSPCLLWVNTKQGKEGKFMIKRRKEAKLPIHIQLECNAWCYSPTEHDKILYCK